MGRFVAAALCRRVGTPRQSGAATSQLSLAGAGGLGATVTTRELFHAPGGVDEFLFAGKKRMAGSADADSNISFGRASMINRAARANDIGLLIIGMNVRLHVEKRAQNLAANR